MAKILVLCTHDSHQAGGHGWSTSKKLEKQGHEVCLITLDRCNSVETENYFFDSISKWRNLNIWRLLYFHIDAFILNKIMKPDSLHGFETSGLYGMSAKRILKKCPFKPEIIFITWTARLLTPKTVRELYDLTGAKMVFIMVDEALLAACHYPANCDGFTRGCKNCSGVKYFKCLPRRYVSMKEKYWSDMPAEIRCTNFDRNLANKVPFLNHMSKIVSFVVPDTTPIISKHDARQFFGISDEDYVIFAGANDVLLKRKGFEVLVNAINILANKNETSRPITLLLIGHVNGIFPYRVDKKINLLVKDFLPLNDFFKAYYACDVHASPTLADSGPMMVKYSVACGRPVVAFPVGHAVDLIVTGETGYLAEYGNANDFATGLYYFYTKDKSELEKCEAACKTLMSQLKN